MGCSCLPKIANLCTCGFSHIVSVRTEYGATTIGVHCLPIRSIIFFFSVKASKGLLLGVNLQCGLLFSSAFVKAPRLFHCVLRVLSRIQDDRVQDDAAIENGRISSLQPSGRRTALVGKWGSTFWKDCQPMQAHAGGSESGQESKSGSEYKSEEGFEGDSSDAGEARAGSEDDDQYKETEKVQRDLVDVPVDEMLSDDYYEEDGDDQSDSLPYRPVNHSSGYNSKPQSRSAANNIVARNSRTANGEEDDD